MNYRKFALLILMFVVILSIKPLDNPIQSDQTDIKGSGDNLTISWIRPAFWADANSRVKIEAYSFDFQINVLDALEHSFTLEYQILKTGFSTERIAFDNNILISIPIDVYERGEYDFKIIFTSLTDPERIVEIVRLIEFDIIYEIEVQENEIVYAKDGQNTENRFCQASFNIIHSSVIKNRNFKTIIPEEYQFGTNYNIFRGTNKIYPSSGSNNLEKIWFTNEYRATDTVLFNLPLPTYSENEIYAPIRNQEGQLIQRIDFEITSKYEFTNLVVSYNPSYMFQEDLWNFTLFIRDGLKWIDVAILNETYAETFGSVKIEFGVDSIDAGAVYEYRLEAYLLGQERNTELESYMLPIFPLGMFVLIWLPLTWKEMGYNSLREKIGTRKYILITVAILAGIYVISHLIFRFTS